MASLGRHAAYRVIRVNRLRSATVRPGRASGNDGVWSPGRRRLTIGLVVTITLFASEALAVATVMPDVALDLGRAGYGAAFSAFFLGSVVGALVGGPAADRYGPAPPLAVAGLIFAVSP